jgi:glycosyltransferase involved in cell wall biosynthesis
MRILLASRNFLPNIGGVETATDAIARGLARRQHHVTVVTVTPAAGPDDLPYRVLRHPSPAGLLAAVRHCDIYVQNNISLRGLWPLLLAPRPWIVVHHIYLRQRRQSLTPAERAKRWTLRWARSIAVSRAVARDLPFAAAVIPESYRDDVFRVTNHGQRHCDLGFLGRFIPEKGADLLLAALARLRRRKITPRLRMMGSGAEEPGLRRSAALLGLAAQVEFVGPAHGERLVGLLNECRILVVPSRWAEPFGIVALEAIACGCVVVGSSGGGLPDAMGPCGVTFPNGDEGALADRLAELLLDPQRIATLRAKAAAHLAEHTPDAVAAAWLRVMDA